jgi:hypothetical protein
MNAAHLLYARSMTYMTCSMLATQSATALLNMLAKGNKQNMQ